MFKKSKIKNQDASSTSSSTSLLTSIQRGTRPKVTFVEGQHVANADMDYCHCNRANDHTLPPPICHATHMAATPNFAPSIRTSAHRLIMLSHILSICLCFFISNINHKPFLFVVITLVRSTTMLCGILTFNLNGGIFCLI